MSKLLAEFINDIAEEIETGKSKSSTVRIAVTNLDSELGADNVNKAMESFKDVEFTVVGTPYKDYNCVEAANDEEVAEALEHLFNEGKIDAAVAMHYPFPIGVSTVGRTVTPAMGKEVYIATTTGTTHMKRDIAMVLNTINGIIAAKANGIEHPTVGILNIEAARIVEKKLNELKNNGFEINFAESKRAEGGAVLRGNDLVAGTCDVVVMDSLTGNVLIKTFASFTSGGFFETAGFGYGPGLGEGYHTPVFIVSRASGTPVIRNAIQYAVESVRGKLVEVSKKVYADAKKAGLEQILASMDKKEEKAEAAVAAPPKEVVTAQIPGIDILEMDTAVQALWKEGIYAESAMGCTGPIVLISEANKDKAAEILTNAGLIS